MVREPGPVLGSSVRSSGYLKRALVCVKECNLILNGQHLWVEAIGT